ncbi:hypothetical protein [Halostagnicola kamekurae]|uniref:Uncharacterized protein n=1 Tax=Halostagnicola kamekurae TaxID=619731 RepID=A0A1I6RFL2_9EURY|nr:hypothetical protein [Halostagnicola kamekurae]SFS63258.1 hypothetical protein SAMN04488556_1746 [Halostagnicola kamekurae]
MRTQDIERTAAQLRRVTRQAEQIVDEARTIDDAGFDVSSAAKILEQQQELADDLAQAMANYNALLARANSVAPEQQTWIPGRDAFALTHDESSTDVEIAYSAPESIDAADVVVTLDGQEIDPFATETIADGDTATVDVSGAEELVVEWTAEEDRLDEIDLRDWTEILDDAEADTPEFKCSTMELPEHDLSSTARTFSTSLDVSTEG